MEIITISKRQFTCFATCCSQWQDLIRSRLVSYLEIVICFVWTHSSLVHQVNTQTIATHWSYAIDFIETFNETKSGKVAIIWCKITSMVNKTSYHYCLRWIATTVVLETSTRLHFGLSCWLACRQTPRTLKLVIPPQSAVARVNNSRRDSNVAREIPKFCLQVQVKMI